MVVEIWKDIKGFEGLYKVSSLGRVKSIDRSIIQKDGKLKNLKSVLLKNQKCSNGYLFVGLCKNSIKRLILVHRLVAIAFIETTDKNIEVNHKDENKENNHVHNLEWISHKKNINHGTAIKRRVSNSNFKGENNPMYGLKGILNKNSRKILQYNIDGVFIEEHASGAEASRKLGISKSSIYRCANGFENTSKGFLWKYKK